MSSDAMFFTGCLVGMSLIFVLVAWGTWLYYRFCSRELSIREAELYTKHKP